MRPPLPPPPDAAAVAARALGYPYPRPASSSFVWHAGRTHPFPDAAWRGVPRAADLPVLCPAARDALARLAAAGATPVLGIGSNAAPSQLARKFSAEAGCADAVVIATRALLLDHDVTYAALISSYGSATATLTHSPAAAVGVYVTWLSDALLERMHATEAAYDLVRLPAECVVVGASVEDR